MVFDNWRQWLNQSFRGLQQRKPHQAANRFRPSLEPLEDRLVPASTAALIEYSGATTTSASSVTFTVVFESAATTGLTADDLTLTGTAGVGTIGTITPNGSDTQDTVQVTGLTGASGTLILNLDSEVGLSNTVSNLPVASPTVTLMPTVSVVSITHTSPASLTTNATSLTYTITFSSAVTGLTASNFSLTGSAASDGTIGTPTTTDNIHWTVPITVTSGANGTLTLNLANDTGLSSTVSNTLPLAGDTYTLDSAAAAPTFTSASSAGFLSGTAGSFQVTATGTPAPTFILVGAPSWLHITASGLLYGTPPTITSLEQVFTFTIEASNGNSPDAAQTFSLTVAQARRRGAA